MYLSSRADFEFASSFMRTGGFTAYYRAAKRECADRLRKQENYLPNPPSPREQDPESADLTNTAGDSGTQQPRVQSGVSQPLSTRDTHAPSVEWRSGKPVIPAPSPPGAAAGGPAAVGVTITKTSSNVDLDKLPEGDAKGMLSAVLRGDAVPADRSDGGRQAEAAPGTHTTAGFDIDAATTAVAVGAAVLLLTIFVPGRTPALRVRVPEAATVADVIAELVRYCSRRAEAGGAPLVSDPACYELRLHERNGDPDLDFPSLDRSRKISNFGQGRRQLVHEYVLRVMPSAVARLNRSAAGPTLAEIAGVAALRRPPRLPEPMPGPSDWSVGGADGGNDALPPVLPGASTGLGQVGSQPSASSTAPPPAQPSALPAVAQAAGSPSAPAAGAAELALLPVSQPGSPAGRATPRRAAGGGVQVGTAPQGAALQQQHQTRVGSPLLMQPPSVLPTPSLRVVIPGVPTPTVTMVPLTAGLRVQGALEFVARRHRLPVFHEPFVLRVVAADQARLGLPTRELPPALLVAPLGLDTVELVRKTFADSPAASGADAGGAAAAVLPRRQRPYDGDGAESGDDAGRPGTRGGADRTLTSTGLPSSTAGSSGGGGGGGADPMSSRLTPSSATRYEEWPVIKTNQRGRRQARLLGIDLTRITNKKVDKQRFLASDKTASAERLVADVWLVEVLDSDPRAFAITFKAEGSSAERLVRVAYEARSASDRDAIVSKLAYILGMNGDRHKLRRSA